MAGSNTRDLISGLKKPRRGKTNALKIKPRGKITPSAGKGFGSNQLSNAGGGSSKYREVPDSRLFYEELKELRSSSGALVLLYNNTSKLKFKDEGGAVVEFYFANVTLP
jgi:hypothetical protein